MIQQMSSSDMAFYASIVICIAVGNYYKHITDVNTKRNYGTGLGVLITYLICGSHIYYSILITWGNIIIIKCCDRRYIHQLSLIYTWTYLGYLHYIADVETPPYILWIHQTIALRLVGLAFEMYAADKHLGSDKLAMPTDENIKAMLKIDNPDPSALEIISYAYYFIGLHKGPYYRWKVFQDHFNYPFGVMGDCRIITEQKLKKAAAFTLLFFVLRSNFSPQLYYEDKFYLKYGADVRLFYNIPHLAMYCLYHQIIMMLCTSICTESGFGIYPAQCASLPGHGPSRKFSLLRLAVAKNDAALSLEYNFATLRSFQLDKLVLGPRLGDTLKSWNMSIGYWFSTHSYKHICNGDVKVREALSVLAWTVWSGPSQQQLIISSTIWMHCYLEALYYPMYEQTEQTDMTKDSWKVCFSVARLFCLVYLVPCLIVQDLPTVLKYYNSIYWVYHMLLLAVIAVIVLINKVETATIEE